MLFTTGMHHPLENPLENHHLLSRSPWNRLPATTSVLQHFFVKIPHFFEFSLLGYWDYGLEVGFFSLNPWCFFWPGLVLYNPPRLTHDLIPVPGAPAAWSAFRLYFCFLYHSYGVCGDSGKGIYKSITTRREATRV